MMFRRSVLLFAVLCTVVVLLVPSTASAAGPYCGITWGSDAKYVNAPSPAKLVNIRAGQHDCYDRLAFDFTGDVQGYSVSYVDNVYYPTGGLVPLRGGAKLEVRVYGGSAGTYSPPDWYEVVDTAGYRTFRQVAFVDGHTEWTTAGLGVRARLPFRVLTLPDRIVVDVAHFW
jgi:hypothetical protein